MSRRCSGNRAGQRVPLEGTGPANSLARAAYTQEEDERLFHLPGVTLLAVSAQLSAQTWAELYESQPCRGLRGEKSFAGCPMCTAKEKVVDVFNDR